MAVSLKRQCREFFALGCLNFSWGIQFYINKMKFLAVNAKLTLIAYVYLPFLEYQYSMIKACDLPCRWCLTYPKQHRIGPWSKMPPWIPFPRPALPMNKERTIKKNSSRK
jgi:hypothetical protein